MEAGIDIHNPIYGAWWETKSHLKNASAYNASWIEFFQTNRTFNEIHDYARKQMENYSIPTQF